VVRKSRLSRVARRGLVGLAVSAVAQGDIWLVEEPDRKARPCLVLTRPGATPLLTALMVAPLTRTRRGIPTELPIGPDDGVRFDSVASFDNVATIERAFLTRRLGRLAEGRWHEVCAAMRTAIGC
jgi:mRNA interferase MazF